MPSTPQLTHPKLRRLWGFLHKYLRRFSRTYCSWVGTTYDNQIAQLPFGLILKCSDGTRIEEVLAMQVARRAGLPVPRVIRYGEHPDTPHAPVSILMTRLPGEELGRVYESLSSEEKLSILHELKGFMEVIRGWANPWAGTRICSLIGSAIRSIRVPNHFAGPFESEQELSKYLLSPSHRRRLTKMPWNVPKLWREYLIALSLPTVIFNPIIYWYSCNFIPGK